MWETCSFVVQLLHWKYKLHFTIEYEVLLVKYLLFKPPLTLN